MSAENTKEVIEQVDAQLKAFEETTKNAISDGIAAGKTESAAEITALKDQLAEIDKALKANQQQLALIGKGVPGLDEEIKNGKMNKFSVSKLAQGLYNEKRGIAHAWDNATMEKEVCDANYKFKQENGMIEKSSNFSTSQEAGGVLIPQAILDLVGLVYPAIPMLDKLPVQKLEGLVGDIKIPRLLSGFTCYQVGENVAPTGSAVKYSEIVMRPRRSAGLTFQSKTLMFQSGGASDGIVKTNLQLQLARQIHNMLMNGNGNDYQPLGLNGWIGTDALKQIADSGLTIKTDGTVSGNGGRFTITDAAMLQGILEEANEGDASPDSYGYLMRPIVKTGMKTERVLGTATGKGLPVNPSKTYISDSDLTSLAGLIATSTQVGKTDVVGTSSSCSKVFYGNWKYFYVGFWADMALRVSDTAYAGGISAFDQNGMFIIAEQSIDCAVVRPTALTYAKGAETDPTKW